MSDAVHRFDESCEKARVLDDAWWRRAYAAAFPTCIGVAEVKGDCEAQRDGIDRIVLLPGGRSILVDEKTRLGDWPDILLEVWSDAERKKKGWIVKPNMHCDYVAYAFAATGVCYLLPYSNLRAAWRRFGREWWSLAVAKEGNGFKVIRAPNPGYTTVSVAVPIDTVLMAIADTMLVKVS
jgi:hypothetical protein